VSVYPSAAFSLTLASKFLNPLARAFLFEHGGVAPANSVDEHYMLLELVIPFKTYPHISRI
jgi:hypothetical protein